MPRNKVAAARNKVSAARVKLAAKRSAELQRLVRKRTVPAQPTRFTMLPADVQELIAADVFSRRNIRTYNFIDPQPVASLYARARRSRDKGRPLVHSAYDAFYLQTPPGRRAYTKNYLLAEARVQRRKKIAAKAKTKAKTTRRRINI